MEKRSLDGGAFRARRRQKNWSMDELARRIGTTQATISRIETNRRSPSGEMLDRLCTELGLELLVLPCEYVP